jgi:hypothetical protein
MGKRKSPETEIRSGVGDSSQHELDCLNQLVNNNVCGCTMTIFLLRLVLEQYHGEKKFKLLFFMMIIFVLFINNFVSVFGCCCCLNILKRDLL